MQDACTHTQSVLNRPTKTLLSATTCAKGPWLFLVNPRHIPGNTSCSWVCTRGPTPPPGFSFENRCCCCCCCYQSSCLCPSLSLWLEMAVVINRETEKRTMSEQRKTMPWVLFICSNTFLAQNKLLSSSQYTGQLVSSQSLSVHLRSTA